jgi:hypothetical protein
VKVVSCEHAHAVDERAHVVDGRVRLRFAEHLRRHREANAATLEQLAQAVITTHAAMLRGTGTRATYSEAVAAFNRHEEAFAATVVEAWRLCTDSVDEDARRALAQCWYSYRAALALQRAAVDTLLQGYALRRVL